MPLIRVSARMQDLGRTTLVIDDKSSAASVPHSMKAFLAVALAISLAATGFALDGDIAKVGAPPPLGRCQTVGGKPFALDALKGKVTLLIIFSKESVPAMLELDFVSKNIASLHKADGLITVAIGRDSDGAQLTDLATANPANIQYIADPKREVFGRFAAKGVPRCYVIGADGLIKYASLGFDEWEADRIKAAVDSEFRKDVRPNQIPRNPG